ncbi:hypothetical protein CRYUN_Cryun30bG0065100 [Craigia yunnanensis]
MSRNKAGLFECGVKSFIKLTKAQAEAGQARFEECFSSIVSNSKDRLVLHDMLMNSKEVSTQISSEANDLIG